MTCNECQRSLLQLLDPSAASADLAGHLTECAVCRQFQLRLVRIDTNVRRMPVPASQGLAAVKRALLDLAPQSQGEAAAQPDTVPMELAGAPTETIPIIVPGPASLAPRRAQTGSRWLLAGLAMAAAVMLGAVGLFQILHRPAPNEDLIVLKNPDAIPPEKIPVEKPKEQPLLAELLDCDVRLAAADNPRKRIEVMAEVVGHLQDGVESKPDPETMQALALMYQLTLVNGLAPSAERLPDMDRQPRILAPIINDLTDFLTALRRLAPGEAVKTMTVATTDTQQGLAGLIPWYQAVGFKGSPRKHRDLAVNWKRDFVLVRAMVDTATKLVVEEKPLQRARVAQELAVELGKDMQQAASKGNDRRGIEVGHYLGRLLTGAVAHNIRLARLQEPDHKDVDLFAQEVADSTQAIASGLREVPGMQDTLQAIDRARADVEKSAAAVHRP
jgi:hypothetical protein